MLTTRNVCDHMYINIFVDEYSYIHSNNSVCLNDYTYIQIFQDIGMPDYSYLYVKSYGCLHTHLFV